MAFEQESKLPEIIVTESLLQHQLRTQVAVPRFIQGLFPFVGTGLTEALDLGPEASYEVPSDCSAEVIYLRAGNPTDELIYLILCKDQRPIRYFPLSKNEAIHISLAIQETHSARTLLSIKLGATRGLKGNLVLDLGLIEVKSA
jgi:hypothetical protein